MNFVERRTLKRLVRRLMLADTERVLAFDMGSDSNTTVDLVATDHALYWCVQSERIWLVAPLPWSGFDTVDFPPSPFSPPVLRVRMKEGNTRLRVQMRRASRPAFRDVVLEQVRLAKDGESLEKPTTLSTSDNTTLTTSLADYVSRRPALVDVANPEGGVRRITVFEGCVGAPIQPLRLLPVHRFPARGLRSTVSMGSAVFLRAINKLYRRRRTRRSSVVPTQTPAGVVVVRGGASIPGTCASTTTAS